jgi:hypothetical protein
MKHNDLTIIIQGPIVDSTFFALAHYYDIAKVVFSFMDNDQVPEFLKKFNSERIKVTTYFEHEIQRFYENNIMCYHSWNCNHAAIRQIYSVKKALDLVDTKYCINTRSDEFYENIDSVLFKLKEQEDVVIANDFFYKSFEEEPYYMSDHLYGSSTDLLKNSLSVLWQLIENKKITLNECDGFDKTCCSPQQYLAIAIMNNFANTQGLKINKDNFEKHIKRIDISELGNYKILEDITHNIFYKKL